MTRRVFVGPYRLVFLLIISTILIPKMASTQTSDPKIADESTPTEDSATTDTITSTRDSATTDTSASTRDSATPDTIASTRDSATADTSASTRDSATTDTFATHDPSAPAASPETPDPSANTTASAMTTTRDEISTEGEDPTSPPEEPLSAGAIAGIVIGALVGVAVIAGGVGYAVIYCKGSSQVSPESNVSKDIEVQSMSREEVEVNDKAHLTPTDHDQSET